MNKIRQILNKHKGARAKYWSGLDIFKKIRKMVGYEKPNSATIPEWSDWRRNYKKNHKNTKGSRIKC